MPPRPVETPTDALSSHESQSIDDEASFASIISETNLVPNREHGATKVKVAQNSNADAAIAVASFASIIPDTNLVANRDTDGAGAEARVGASRVKVSRGLLLADDVESQRIAPGEELIHLSDSMLSSSPPVPHVRRGGERFQTLPEPGAVHVPGQPEVPAQAPSVGTGTAENSAATDGATHTIAQARLAEDDAHHNEQLEEENRKLRDIVLHAAHAEVLVADGKCLPALSRKTKIALALLFSLLVALAVVLGVVFGRNVDPIRSIVSPTGAPSSSMVPTLMPSRIPTHIPSYSPTSTPSSRPSNAAEGELFQLLAPVLSDGGQQAVLDNPTSPQHRAFQWLVTDKISQSSNDARRIQRFALATFFYATGGENWLSPIYGWLSDSSECTGFWSGLSCDSNLVVNNISLPNRGVNQNIPPEIGLLTGLIDLRLWDNRITGSIPTEIGRLTNLLGLGLFNNLLTGIIPSEIGDMQSLSHYLLLMRNNDLGGSIPSEIGLLSFLGDVQLFDTSLSGSLPTEIGTMSSLSLFLLFGTSMFGPIPSEIGSLPSLRILTLPLNNFTGTIPTELGLLSGSLQQLYLESNDFHGSLPTSLGSLTRLLDLRISSNRLSGILPSELGRLSNLGIFYLNNNNFQGSLPAELCAFADNIKDLRADCDKIMCCAAAV